MPLRDKFEYTFDNIAGVIDRFTNVISFNRFAVYVFDHGACTSPTPAIRQRFAGPIGWISEGRLRIALRPMVRHHVAIRGVLDAVPPVALVKMTLGDDGRLLTAIESFGYRGLVVKATGGGHVPRATAEMLGPLAQKMPVVLASRTGAGEVLHNTYGFVGSETDLLKRGLIHAGILDGLKARLLLTLLLIAGADNRTIVEAFAAAGIPGSGPAFCLRNVEDFV